MSEEIVPYTEVTRRMVHRGLRHALGLAGAGAFIALALLVAGLLWPKHFQSSATILVQEKNIIQPLMEGAAVSTTVADRASIAREVIFGRKVLEDILKTGGWLESNPSPLEQAKLMDEIRGRTSISAPRQNLITISYSDSNARRSYDVTKRMASDFIHESLEAKRRESRDAFEFINTQVKEYHKKLTDAEAKIKAYRQANPDAQPGSQADVNERISALRQQLESANIDQRELQSEAASLQAQISGQSEVTAVQTREGQYRARLAELQNRLDKLLLTYTDQYPDVVRTRHEIEDLRASIDAEAERKQHASAGDSQDIGGKNSSAQDSQGSYGVEYNPLYQELNSKLADIKRKAASTSARESASSSLLQQELGRAKRIANSENELAELTRDYEVNRDVYQDLLKRRENARVSMNLDAEHRGLSMKIQDPATLPLRPSGLRLLHFSLAGLLLGLAIPMSLLFMAARFDPRVQSATQIERITGYTVLATIPTYNTSSARHRAGWRITGVVFLALAVGAAYAVVFWMKMRNYL